MKKAEIEVGKKYVMKVSGKLVPVLVSRTCEHGGWYGVNTVTGREVRIRTAAKLRRECVPYNGPVYIVRLGTGQKTELPVPRFKKRFAVAGSNFQDRLVQIRSFFADAVDWELADFSAASQSSQAV